MRLAALLRYHWIAGGNLSDGRRWLDRMLLLSAEHSAERGEALWAAAWVCLIQGDRDHAQRHLAECRRIAVELDDEVLAAHADHWDALREVFNGEVQHAIRLFRAAIAIHRRVGDTASALTALFMLALAQIYADRNEDALATCREVLAESGEHRERWTHAYAHQLIRLYHWRLGELDAARLSQIASLEIQRDFLDGICIANTIEQMSWTASSKEQYEQAAIVYKVAQAVWRGLGTTVSAFGPVLTDSEQMMARVRRELGESRFQTILVSGPEPSKEQAIELALAAARTAYGPTTADRKPERPKPDVVAGGGAWAAYSDNYGKTAGTRLTKREAQVAALVAEGQSNKEIAAVLVVSPRTVDGHIERILAKLGFTSRAQIAVWVAGHVSPGRTTPP